MGQTLNPGVTHSVNIQIANILGTGTCDYNVAVDYLANVI